ncbi:hypothetical protein RhiirA4_474444 [Rhizophagus irregularis]|uniref:RNase H type-1 domain-containing protein n=1 Tax=Rhizophagus irregularis TaxID=588596 RepID=A0A2I1H8G6_9GLOM|nr:hypothetical protein RhiirA4_474444 [Rhizophagus irregularis]
MSQIRNRRNNAKIRCVTNIRAENCIKINANSIQNDRYIADIAIYEALAQAECKYYGKMSVDACNIERVNSLLRYIHLSEYRNVLLEIANSLKQESDIEIYTDGSMKNMTTSEITMGCAFIISAPIEWIFNCSIEDNLSFNKAELMAVLLSIMVCPKAANVIIYSDSQWVINIFENLYYSTINEIERSKINYKILWLCLFKIIGINNLKVKIIKVKAHSDCDYNKKVDILAKAGAKKNTILIEDKFLLHNGTICWRGMPIERNPILMIKGIKDAQVIEEFLTLQRNQIYRQSDLLRLIDWKISLKLNNINQHNTLFEDHYLRSFRIKICCGELPTCANLKKRKPDLYDKGWKCNFCKVEEETFEHFWVCVKMKDVVKEIIKRFKSFLVKFIQESSREEIDTQELFDKITELNMWEIGDLYDFTLLMKNQVSYQLIDLLKHYKIIDEKLLYKVLIQIIRRILLEFKVLIWEPRNKIQLREEKRCGISGKDKRAKSNSKKQIDKEVNVNVTDCVALENSWNK